MYGTDIGVDRYWYSKWHMYECGTVCGTGTYKCSKVNRCGTGTGRANGTGMGLGSAILVKTYTGHSLFFRLSFKHQYDIKYDIYRLHVFLLLVIN